MPIKKRVISNRQKESRQCFNDDILELFRKSIKDDSVFIRLTAIIHTTLEQNIGFEEALNLKTVIGNRLLKTGQLIEESVPFIRAGYAFHCGKASLVCDLLKVIKEESADWGRSHCSTITH